MSDDGIWTNDTVLEFLSHYRDEEMIWNHKHPCHRNQAELRRAWDRIRQAMSIECTVMDMKRKKESLMTGYRMNVKKLKSHPPSKPTLYYFDFMHSFLGELYMGDDIYNIQEALNDAEEQQNSFNDLITEAELRPIKTEMGTQSFSKRVSSKPASKHSHKRKSEPTTYKSEPTTYTPMTPTYSFEKKEETNTGEMDECDLYAQLLAKKIRKLSERQRDIVMHAIDNLVFQAKMKMDSDRGHNSQQQSRTVKNDGSPVFITSEENDYEEEYLEDPMPD